MAEPHEGRGTTAGPLITVVVPAYNAARYLGDALGSIAAQRGLFETEVLVVDDGSTDTTAGLAAGFAGVRVIRQPNLGPSAARNRGIAEARGDLIAFLDADDLWTPGALAALLEVLERHEDAGLAFGDCRIFSDDGPRARSQFEEQGLEEAFFGGAERVQDPYARLFRLNYIPTGAVLARKACIETAGGFDESLRRVEDMDLWFRMALACPFVYTRTLCELKREHRLNVSADLETMTLAYIQVLERQARDFPKELRRRGIRIGRRVCLEQCLVGDKRARRGDPAGARAAFAAAFRARPSLRPVYYWLRTLLPGQQPMPSDRG
jgi:glycosyltransferase involved in cell wall biosynthesis